MSRIYPVEKLGNLDLQALYVQSNEWLDDIEFLEAEMSFFKKIFKTYFYGAVPGITVKVVQVEKQLSKLELSKHVIHAEVINHREVLDLLIKHFITHDEETLRQQHLKLEVKVNELNQAFRKFKNELFRLTEELVAKKDASGEGV